MRSVFGRAGIVVIWVVEFVQNLPLASAFVFGFGSHIAGDPARMTVRVLAGVTAGALLIRYTEPWIEPGPIEKTAETLTNVVFFSLAILGFIYYFSWKSGSWMVDLGLSTGAGVALGQLQARAAGERPSLHHSAALALAFAVAMLLIRFWALTAPPLAAALALTTSATTVIVAIDYLPRK